MNAQVKFKIEWRPTTAYMGYELLEWRKEWLAENPDGSLEDFLIWANIKAHEMFEDDFDFIWANLIDDLESKDISVVNGLDISPTEWDLLKQIDGQGVFEL